MTKNSDLNLRLGLESTSCLMGKDFRLNQMDLKLNQRLETQLWDLELETRL